MLVNCQFAPDLSRGFAEELSALFSRNVLESKEVVNSSEKKERTGPCQVDRSQLHSGEVRGLNKRHFEHRRATLVKPLPCHCEG